MFSFIKGCSIKNPESITEGYKKYNENSLAANVSVENIKGVFGHFIVMHEEPMFFILELPVESDKEKTVSPGVVEEFHKDVYYIDGCSAEECVYLLETYGELLINDGLCSFGFGCHNSGDEIMLGKYNLISIYSKNLAVFEGFFEAHKIENNDNLVLAGSVISRDNPGTSEALTIDGLRIYDLPERLKDWNIYLAETRAE